MIDLSSFQHGFAQWRFRKNVKMRKKLYSKLSKMLANSVPIKEALIELKKRRLEQFSEFDLQAVAISDWVQRIASGDTFASSLNGWVPHDEQNIISGGEQSGRISETLINLVVVLNAKTKMKTTIVKAITYPSIILSLSVMVLAGFGGYMVPYYEEVAPGIVWHGMAEKVSLITAFFANYIIWLVALIILLAVGFYWSLNSWVKGLRVKFDRFGPYAVFSMLQGVSWLIAFSSLIQAGVTIKDALKQTSIYASPWLKTRIDAVYRRLGDYSLGEAMAKTGYDFPDREVINDLTTYSKFSGFDQALKSLADDWLEESIETITKKVARLNVLGIILAACVILFIALGMNAMSQQMQEQLSQGL